MRCVLNNFLSEANEKIPEHGTLKSQIFVRYLFSYISYFWNSTKFNIVWKFLFALKPLNVNVIFFADPRRPSKVRKLVRTNQFQVESTKIGTVQKFVTLQ